jgi:hypothetical protein
LRRETIWLVVATPRDAATGAVVTVRLAGGGSLGYRNFGSKDWFAGLDKPPVIAQNLGFEDGSFGEGASQQAFELRWGGTAKRLASLAALYWRDAPFTLYSGPDGGADGEFTTVISGRIADAPVASGFLKLAMIDPSLDLAKPVTGGLTFAGTGGVEGGAALKGQTRRRAAGVRRNVELKLFDPANNIWVATDPNRPLQAIDQLYDKGNAASSVVVVLWAGSVAATLSALAATACPAGGGAVAPSIGCIKWWYADPGKLTCDLRGEIGAGYVETTADIAAWLIASVSGPVVNPASLIAARALRPGAAGVLVSGENAGSLLTELLAGVSLWWGVNAAGQIEFGAWAWGAPVATITGASFSRVKTHKPVTKQILGYRPNNTVMQRGDIAAALLISSLVDAAGNAVSLVNPGVLTVAQKIALAPIEAERDDRTTRLSLRASALGISTTALSAARTTWLARLIASSTSWRDQTTEATLEAAAYPAYATGTYTMTAGAGNGVLTALASNGAGLRDSAFFGAGSFANTGNYANAAITIDYGAPIAIDRVYIAPAARAEAGWGISYTHGNVLEVSNDASAWTTIATLSGHVDYASKPYDVAGMWRYVRVRTPSSGSVALAEFYAAKAAFAPITTGVYAISTPPSGSNYNEAGLVSNGFGLRDGNYAGAASIVATGTYSGANVSIDFTQSTFVDQIVIAPINVAAGWGPSYVNGKPLEASNDGTTWTTIATLWGHIDGLAKAYPIAASWRYVRVSGYIGLGDFYATKAPREARDADSLAYDAQLNALDKAISEINATTSTWNGTTGTPANLTALSGAEAIQNTLISISGGALTGIGAGNSTLVANSLITLPALGAGPLATASAVNLDTQVLEGTSYKRFAVAEQTKLTGIAAGAQVNPANLAALDSAANTKLAGIATAADVTAAQPIVSRFSPTTGQALNNFGASNGFSFSQIAGTGSARDGDVITFPAAYPAVPNVIFLPGGNAAAAGQNIAISPVGLTVSGFTMKAKSQAVTGGATITDGSSTAGTGSEPTRVINRTNGGAPFDGSFLFRYSVSVGNITVGEPGSIQVGLYVKIAGVWTQVGANYHSVTGTYSMSVTPSSVDFGAGNEFGISVLFSEGTGTSLSAFLDVKYVLGTVTETSLTPATASPIQWMALLQ